MVGIDLLDSAIQEASRYASEARVADRVRFVKASATQIPFANASFDVVWASNVTSFITAKNKAAAEYARVLRDRGFLVFIPIWYATQPPEDLLNKVENAIGCRLDVRTKQEWISLAASAVGPQGQRFELIYDDDFAYEDHAADINEYCASQFAKAHLKNMTPEVKDSMCAAYVDFMKTFNENLQYCRFSILLFQSRCFREERELFTARRLGYVP